MSITVKILKGTNSLSADRITINDNFKINTDAINDILGIVNTTTGKFDNTNVGADNTITTEGITLTESGVDVQNGNVSIQNGNVVIPSNGSYVELGADNSRMIDKTVTVGASGPNSTHIVGLSNFIAIEVPRLTTVQLTDISLGATGPNIITFDSDTNQFKGFNGTSWVVLG